MPGGPQPCSSCTGLRWPIGKMLRIIWVVFYKLFRRVPVVLKVGPDGVVDAGKLQDCNDKSVQQLRNDDRLDECSDWLDSRPDCLV